MIDHKRRAAIRRNNKQIASERILILFELAKKVFKQEPELAQRYVNLARKIGMHYKVRLPTEYKRMICKKCKGFILPGVNCRVRTLQRREPHIVITCLNCGSHTRIPLKKRKKTNGYKKANTENQKRDS